ncbi:MAG TPA: DNRLRE domain-containing protein, partial [Caldilineae bacterium]|nr:DNRLRE domain-containing protein [Caldilineae bacterium]
MPRKKRLSPPSLFTRPLGVGLTLALLLLLTATTLFALAPTSGSSAAPAAANNTSWQRAWKGDGYVYALVGRDAQDLLGVGSEGMILNSSDGGESWHYQSPYPDHDLYDLSMVGLNLWAVGQNGVILYSGDGGVSWRKLNVGLTTDLHGVHFLNATDGWAVGASGLIVHSNDGGSSWNAQPSGVGVQLQAVRMFADGLHGVAVGAAGTLLTSADGGVTWNQHAGLVPDWVTLHDVHVEGAHAWVAGDGDNILISNDQGATWTAQKVGTGKDLLAVEFAPGQSQIGWAAGRDGSIARTSDGGATWPLRSSGDPGYDLYGLGVANTTSAWVGGSVQVSNDGDWGGPVNPQSWFVWRTTDGSTWEHMIGGHYPRFFAVFAASDQVAYAVGDHVAGLKTEDGGYSWRELYDEFRTDPATVGTANHNGSWLMAISCAPGSTTDCHAVGRFGLVLHTTDGGESWRREYAHQSDGTVYGRYLYDINRTSASKGLTTGTHHYFRTSNNGGSWQDADNLGGTHTGVELDMISENTGAMAILRPYMKYTRDGGASWAKRSLPGQYGSWLYEAVDAYDVNHDGNLDDVWLAGCARADGAWDHHAPCQSAMVVRTTDGGVSWQDFVFDASVPKLLAIEMLDATTGWAVGVGGSLVHTSDGGATWSKIDVPADGILEGVDVYDENLVYAVGEENVVFLYKPLSTQSVSAPPQQNTTTDGDLGDWTAAGITTIDADSAHTVEGVTPGADDLSGRLRARWWEDRLFLAVDVTDDVVTGDDRVELALDGLDDDSGGGDDDHVFRFYADGRSDADGVAVVKALQTHAGGYRLELEIPASALGDDFKAGRTVGINLSLHDDDGAGMESVLIWTAPTLADTPELFATITFAAFGGGSRAIRSLPAGAIDIDGDLGDWSTDETFTLDATTADTVQGEAAGAVDLHATVRSRWWPDYVFIGVRVFDDNVQTGDAAHLAFDGDDDGRQGGPYDWKMRIGADGSVEGGYNALAFITLLPDGYELEVAIPQSMLGGVLQHEHTLGFNISLEDDDSGDARAETWLVWEGASAGGVFADLGALQLQAQKMVLQPGQAGYAGVTDTTIDQWQPTTNYGSDPTVRWRANSGGPVRKSLIRFDLSALPENATVDQATLSLNVVGFENSALNVSAYRMVRDWDVNTATWEQASASAPWDAPGASGADHASAATDQAWISGLGWYDFDVSADVRAFVDGGATNYGWLMEPDWVYSLISVAAAEYSADAALRPKLEILYTLPSSGALPTPTATVTPTNTATPTNTPTPTITPTATDTPTPTI